MRKQINKNFVCLFSILLLSSVVFATGSAKLTKIEIDSNLMGRKMPVNVMVPSGYDSKAEAKKYNTLYLLHGLTGQFSNWAQQGRVERVAEKHGLIIVMPEGENGWYVDSAVDPKAKYESHIIKEVIPAIEKQFRVKTERKNRAIAGLSMGGYGALKFGIKYPDMFVIAGSFSGAIRAPEWDDKTVPAWKVLGTSVMAAYGARDNGIREQNDLFKLVTKMDREAATKLPFLYVDCGTEDGLINQNRELVGLFSTKRIPHEYRQRPGRHDWNFWRAQVVEFGDLAVTHLEQDKKVEKK